jgi:RNA polymerase sigma-70 factor (ECF subfamily)
MGAKREMTSSRTNAEWLEDLRGPDRARAIGDLRASLVRGLRFAMMDRYRVTEEDVEDFVQDALLKILDHLDTFEGRSRFLTWAQKIAVREGLSELRRQRWENITLDDLLGDDEDALVPGWLSSESPPPERYSTRREILALVRHLIEHELTDKQRRALISVAIRGMPIAEVARRMDTNRNALYKVIHDARMRLKRQLEVRGLDIDDLLVVFQ